MISLLIILLLCTIATTKSVVLSVLGKGKINNTTDGIVINGFVFLFSALIFCFNLKNASIETIIFGAVMGSLSVFYMLAYLSALAEGSLSLTGLVNNLAMVVPIAVSAVFYNEPLSIWRFIGIFLTVIALIINTKIDKNDKISKKWCVLIACSFLLNGLVASTTKVYTKFMGENVQNASYVAYSYLFATILSLIVYGILCLKKKNKTCKINISTLLYTLLVGVLLSGFQLLYTYGASVIDGTLLFPAYNGGFTLLLTLTGVLIFKEKLTRKQWAGVIIAGIAILFMCF